MNIAQIIADKRDGQELTEDAIRLLIDGYSRDQVPDYQMAAFAMAVFFSGMTDAETETLTRCMIESGERLVWSGKPVVDKHSTGGIGDKVSIPLAPLLACCDVQVPMISGRGLGATGGTLDKLESIAGYRCELSIEEFRSIVNWNGCSIAGASARIAPADKKLYALRDVTGTIPSIPLITASILSKKVAGGIAGLVLDVKAGSGAFMKTLDQAQALARSLVRVGNRLGVKTEALITDMSQPLGRMVGNALEIHESLQILDGQGPSDLLELILELGSRLLLLAGLASDPAEARIRLQQKIDSGAARERFEQMVHSHGGDLNKIVPLSEKQTLLAPQAGYLNRMNAERIGLAVIEMGGGRKLMGDPLDHSTGLEFLVRLGDKLEQGQPIAHLYAPRHHSDYPRELVLASLSIEPNPNSVPELILDRIR
jgi:pyrimidine-nucleoside phosphorylase